MDCPFKIFSLLFSFMENLRDVSLTLQLILTNVELSLNRLSLDTRFLNKIKMMMMQFNFYQALERDKFKVKLKLSISN